MVELENLILKEEAEVIKRIADRDRKSLDFWVKVLENAEKQVEYWKKQSENSSSLNTRAVANGWYQ